MTLNEKNTSEFKSLEEWRKAKPHDYKIARNKNLLPKIAEYFNWEKPEPKRTYVNKRKSKYRNKKIEWTKDECFEDAKIYMKSYADFIGIWERESNSFDIAKKNKWLYEIYKLSDNFKKKQWTKNECIKEAKKWTTFHNWKHFSPTSFHISQELDYINECTIHMSKKNFDIFTKEDCIKDAKKYPAYKFWRRKSSRCNSAATRNGWLEECKLNLIKETKKWTKEKCIREGNKYDSFKEWELNHHYSYYVACFINDWEYYLKYYIGPNEQAEIDHLIMKKNILNRVKRFNSKLEWIRRHNNDYYYAKNNDFLVNCFNSILENQVKELEKNET